MTHVSGGQPTERSIEASYQNSFGRIAGYLPADRAVVHAWLDEIGRAVERKRAQNALVRHDSVAGLARLIDRDPVTRMYVSLMIEQARDRWKGGVRDIPDLLDHLDTIVTWAPRYTDKIHFPMSALFVYMMYTPAGLAIFRDRGLNQALVGILREWCTYLDSPASRDVLTADQWLSQSAREELKLDDFEIDFTLPYGGLASFNDFFHREIKPDRRPIAGGADPRIIVAPNDGRVVKIQGNVRRTDEFWIKGQRYSLHDMLDGSDLTTGFVGGDVYQSFLAGSDYHRWRAPVSGTVISARVVEGLTFTELESAGFDPDAGTQSQIYEASVNARALIFIQSADPIGVVCVMPVGITEISSLTIGVTPGQQVNKGDELGRFSYGGSSMVLVFQPGAVAAFDVPDNKTGNMEKGQWCAVNSQIAHTG
ncbi:phophatidylserine decarboxylase associated domain-containing protein [Streptomyces sp. 71268]|uniref:phosphatidylserine decarboxylase family protein n=1 Tax=Streptomyces sp. 71268 TaxID=3002640 RepID=UPI0023F63D59|nr:phosphatidylserine decarboxylase family protein [Streptomyces sp. 71268]WEV29218.1 phophatidylserine decarboxylase associated domain-containing protein [Streptomyces sp. 71268]